MHTPLDTEQPNLCGNTCGEGASFSESVMPPPQGGGVQALPIFMGFLSIYAYTLCRRTTKFDVVTHMGRGLFSGGQPCPTQMWQGPSAPQCL